MGTVRLGVFPSLNNKTMQDQIAKNFMNWFIQRFPVGFFSHVYLDTQTGNANQYLVNKITGQLEKFESGQKILTPNLRIIVKQGGNNHDEVFGSLWNVNQQPGAFAIDTDLTGYKPILYDPYGIIIATNEYNVRQNIEINITVQTKADQLAVFNIADTLIKQMYVQIIESDSVLPLPTLLLEYIRSCVFNQEIHILDGMIADETEKNTYKQKINENFAKYLYTSSGGAIKPFKEMSEDGSANYMYRLARKQRLTLHLNKYDGDDGVKKNGVYTSFNISFNGYMEFANPVSFLTSVPMIVRGAKNNWFLKTSSNTDDKNYYGTITFKEVFKDDRHLVWVNSKYYEHFYLESELLMAAKTEKFNLIDDIIDKDDTPTHYYIAKALIDISKEFGTFSKLFKVIIYKNNEPLDESEYDIDENFNFTVRNCDLTIPYYIDIWVNRDMYKDYFKTMEQRLNNIGVNLDWDEANRHISRGYFYNTDIITGITEDDTVDKFVPIKKSDFLVADESFDYYIYLEDKKEYLPVKNEVIESRSDLDYYVKDNSNQMVKIDRDKALQPNSNYDYFIYDRNTNKYSEVKNITEFDPLQQYYVRSTQYGQFNVNIESDN